MDIHHFIYLTKLRPADAVVVKKNIGPGLLDHYILYLGNDRGLPYFIANMRGSGVKVLDLEELNAYLPYFDVNRIRYFEGNASQRNSALQRGINLIGRKGYNLITHNCEHFANYVQTGVSSSRQAQVAGSVVGIALVAFLIRKLFKEESEGND